jgi:hypothetical protein
MRPVRQLSDEPSGGEGFVTTLAPTGSHG